MSKKDNLLREIDRIDQQIAGLRGLPLRRRAIPRTGSACGRASSAPSHLFLTQTPHNDAG